jgi:ferrous iron transport protein B
MDCGEYTVRLTPCLLANLKDFLNPVQLYTFGVASSIQIPCIIAFWILILELGVKNATIIAMSSLVYGLLLAGIMLRVISWTFQLPSDFM